MHNPTSDNNLEQVLITDLKILAVFFKLLSSQNNFTITQTQTETSDKKLCTNTGSCLHENPKYIVTFTEDVLARRVYLWY